MGLKSTEEINQLALEALDKGDFYSAQHWFRNNVKNNPGVISFNNLGVFYMNEGLQLRNGRVRSADKLSLRYLMSAEKYSISYLNLMAIGNWNFISQNYVEASNYFRRACNITDSYVSYNNLGVSLYLQYQNDESILCLEKALRLCDNTDEIGEIYLTYIFSLLRKDKKQALDILHQMIKFNIKHMEMDLFIVAFLCGDLQLASTIISPMFMFWQIDIPVIAMVFECLFQLGQNDTAKQYMEYQINCLEGYDYSTKKEIDSVKKAFYQKEYRKKAISDFHYIPLLIQPCYYIGCKLHPFL